MPYLLSMRKGAYGFQYFVYILNVLFLFQWANLVAKTMGKTVSLAQRRGMIRMK